MYTVLSVNVGRPIPNPYKDTDSTGIDKRPADGPVEVRVPGPKHAGLGSGLVGDFIGDRQHHGGDGQAVYAYAREDLDRWETTLGRSLSNGGFGENLTTSGLNVTDARIGERWRIGSDVVLQVTNPRVPCSTFRGWLGERGWLRTFAEQADPGAYLSIVEPGLIRGGDRIEVVHRPHHDVTIGLVFRALTLEPELFADVLAAGDDLSDEVVDRARRRLGYDMS